MGIILPSNLPLHHSDSINSPRSGQPLPAGQLFRIRTTSVRFHGNGEAQCCVLITVPRLRIEGLSILKWRREVIDSRVSFVVEETHGVIISTGGNDDYVRTCWLTHKFKF